MWPDIGKKKTSLPPRPPFIPPMLINVHKVLVNAVKFDVQKDKLSKISHTHTHKTHTHTMSSHSAVSHGVAYNETTF